ncbi:MAG: CPBP family intramembrane metalloprotease [Chitinophagaceae bacterium]|nr:MAG: CPBP family intramembrane metalloprotease [Chitinophagaceae bacterium]
MPKNEALQPAGISAFWKPILFMLVFTGLLFLCGNARSLFSPAYSFLAYGILGSLAGLVTARFFQRNKQPSFASMGLSWEKKTLFRFVLGSLIGVVIFAIILFVLLQFSELTIRYQPQSSPADYMFLYLPILPLALMEEIGFRSYPQQKLYQAYGPWISQLVIAVAFGLYHVLNGWSLLSSFAGPFVWAFVFGLAAIWSRGIAVPTGIHFTLNMLQTITGMKGSKGAVWILDYPPGTNPVLLERTDKIGLMIQVAVLITALLATYWYVRKKRERSIK